MCGKERQLSSVKPLSVHCLEVWTGQPSTVIRHQKVAFKNALQNEEILQNHFRYLYPTMFVRPHNIKQSFIISVNLYSICRYQINKFEKKSIFSFIVGSSWHLLCWEQSTNINTTTNVDMQMLKKYKKTTRKEKKWREACFCGRYFYDISIFPY